MPIRFFDNESFYYSFDYDPVTRWKKWTENYYGVYWLQKRKLGLWGRLLRLCIGYICIGAVFFLLACLFAGPTQQEWVHDNGEIPYYVFYLRVLAFHTFVGWPVSLFFLTARRLICPHVLTELFYPKTIVYEFSKVQSWIIVAFCIFWWHFAIICCWHMRWFQQMMGYLSQYVPVLYPVFRPWYP